MKAFFKLLLLSFLGFFIAGAYIAYDNQTTFDITKPIDKLKSPYQSFIYATGIIESESTNITIGSAIPGIVTKLFIHTGQKINRGDPLFSIDARETRAKIEVAQSKIKVAASLLTKTRHQYKFDKKLHDYSSASISKQKYLASVDELALAKSNLSLAKAELTLLNKELKRHTVYSPIIGKILQCKIRVGEFIDSRRITTRAIVVGSNKLRLRVDINENELNHFKPKTPAIAFVRKQPNLKIPLHYQYTEPYIVPKTSLTGLSTERTDLRVLQVLYSLDKSIFPLYVGQQLDVFIKVPAKDVL
ncbi:MAG: efflux RND transporter periplasmic adaptor subunit [Pseudomonadota bacterium]